MKFNEVSNVQNSFTIIPSIFPLIVDLILNKKNGIFNCVNKNSISVKQINNIFDRKDIEIIENNFILKNYSNNILSIKNLEKI